MTQVDVRRWAAADNAEDNGALMRMHTGMFTRRDAAAESAPQVEEELEAERADEEEGESVPPPSPVTRARGPALRVCWQLVHQQSAGSSGDSEDNDFKFELKDLVEDRLEEYAAAPCPGHEDEESVCTHLVGSTKSKRWVAEPLLGVHEGDKATLNFTKKYDEKEG